MKRYLVFSHQRYYPDGGWGDCRGVFETIEDAKRCDVTCGWGGAITMPDHAYIVDIQTESVAFSYDAGFWVDVSKETNAP